jgi:SPP1 family phage portal protein
VLRYKIDTDSLDVDTVQDLISYHGGNLFPRYQSLQKYYEAKHDILNKTVSDESKPNNKLVNDYPGYIVDLATGYFLGKPVSYSSKSSNDAYLQAIQDIFDYNDEADENAELGKTCSIKGEAFELVYLDEEGSPRFTQIENEQTMLIYGTDVSNEPILGIRYYQLPTVGSSGTIETTVEAYTKNMVYKFSSLNGKLTPKEQKEHYFGGVPIIHFQNNKELMSDFERVMTLINAYDNTQSDTANDLDYFTEAYLKISGATLGEGEEATKTVQAMKLNRVIELEDGDASFLTKDINDAAVENYKKRLNLDIHKFAKMPDLSDIQFGGNVTGIAIKFKFSPLEQLTSTKERKFKRAIQRRIELITNILNKKGGSYNYTDIETTFTRNLPANITEITDMISKLHGIPSDETLLSQLPFITDVQVEMNKKKQEQKDALSDNYSNLNNDTATNINSDMMVGGNNAK